MGWACGRGGVLDEGVSKWVGVFLEKLGNHPFGAGGSCLHAEILSGQPKNDIH